MRRLFVVGNWKMNTLLASATELARGLAAAAPANDRVDVGVCPPFPYLQAVRSVVEGSGVQLGAQNIHFEKPGAFTGEVAAEMLLDLGCRWVILGHSERRHLLGESDAIVCRKVKRALEAGIAVILCVGETLAERQAQRTEAVLDSQMNGSLEGIAAGQFANIVLAYEPVWAIGTGLNATPEQAQAAHRHLRTWLANRYNPGIAEATRLLYGGSVKAKNAKELMQQPDVDGVLVGGASLELAGFSEIIRAAREVA